MMRIMKGILLVLIGTLQAYDGCAESALSKSLFDPHNASRMILITFKDQASTHIPSSATAYRKHGQYSTPTWNKVTSEQIAADYQLQKVAEWPMTVVGVHCVVYQLPKQSTVGEVLKKLNKDGRVGLAQNMHTFSTKALQKETIDPYAKLQTNLQVIGLDKIRHQVTGKNIKIAIIDTGVDIKHPDLDGQITDNTNFVEAISNDFLHDKHGTAVAGIIAAKKDNGTGIIGIAPDASVIALKACWPDKVDAIEAVCNSFTLAMAVHSAIVSQAKILNMSLAGPHDPILEMLLNKAMGQGMVVVAADTGNPGNTNFPASLQGVIAVKASQPHIKESPLEDNKVAAPGDHILTTLPYGTYDFLSGSSMATAQVSGVVALLLEISPDLSPSKIWELLKNSQLLKGDLDSIHAGNAIASLCKTGMCAVASQSR